MKKRAIDRKKQMWKKEDAKRLSAFLSKHGITQKRVSDFFGKNGVSFPPNYVSILCSNNKSLSKYLNKVPIEFIEKVKEHLADPDSFAKALFPSQVSPPLAMQKESLWTTEEALALAALFEEHGLLKKSICKYLDMDAKYSSQFLSGNLSLCPMEKILQIRKILEDPSDFLEFCKKEGMDKRAISSKLREWTKEDSHQLFSFLDEHYIFGNQFIRFLRSIGVTIYPASFSALQPEHFDLSKVPRKALKEIKKLMQDPEALVRNCQPFRKKSRLGYTVQVMPIPPASQPQSPQTAPPSFSRGQIVTHRTPSGKKKYIVVSDGWEQGKHGWVISLFPYHTDEPESAALCVYYPYKEGEEIVLHQDVQIKDMEQVLANQQAERDERLREQEHQAQNAGRFIKVGDTLYKKASEDQEQGQRQGQEIAAKRLTQSVKKEIEDFKAEQFFAMRSLTNLVGDLLGRVAELEKRLGVKGD